MDEQHHRPHGPHGHHNPHNHSETAKEQATKHRDALVKKLAAEEAAKVRHDRAIRIAGLALLVLLLFVACLLMAPAPKPPPQAQQMADALEKVIAEFRGANSVGSLQDEIRSALQVPPALLPPPQLATSTTDAISQPLSPLVTTAPLAPRNSALPATVTRTKVAAGAKTPAVHHHHHRRDPAQDWFIAYCRHAKPAPDHSYWMDSVDEDHDGYPKGIPTP